jgi:hypothetical protein
VVSFAASIYKASFFKFFDELSYFSGHWLIVLLWYHFVNCVFI